MKQPEGFVIPSKDNVLRLCKILYRLKELGSELEGSCYPFRTDFVLKGRREKQLAYIILYLDDLLVVEATLDMTRAVSGQLVNHCQNVRLRRS